MSVSFPDLPLTIFPDGGVDTFVQMLNITTTDAPLVQQFQTLVQQGQFTQAQAVLATIPSYSQKVITANQINKISQALTGVQRFYKDQIQPYVANKQVEWQGIVNQFSYKGVWSPATQYQVNNFVQYTVNGVNFVYICTAVPPISTTPTNTTYWRVLSIRGQKGDSGVGMSFLYSWNSTTPYTEQDVVTYDDGVWGCTQPNTNQPPYEGSAYWNLIYVGGQVIYPFQPNQPTLQSSGELWFQIIT